MGKSALTLPMTFSVGSRRGKGSSDGPTWLLLGAYNERGQFVDEIRQLPFALSADRGKDRSRERVGVERSRASRLLQDADGYAGMINLGVNIG